MNEGWCDCHLNVFVFVEFGLFDCLDLGCLGLFTCVLVWICLWFLHTSICFCLLA